MATFYESKLNYIKNKMGIKKERKSKRQRPTFPTQTE